jgi:hypothetical protein
MIKTGIVKKAVRTKRKESDVIIIKLFLPEEIFAGKGFREIIISDMT